MSHKNSDFAFSAYVGTDEGPQPGARVGTGSLPGKNLSEKNSSLKKRCPDKPSSRAATPDRKNGRLWVLTLLLMVCASVLLRQHADKMAEYINRPVASVRMETPLNRVSEMEVRSVLALHLDDGFFGLDAVELKHQLEQNPWIAQAVIRRVWPDALAVSIFEETAIARWGDTRLLNQHAEVIAPEVIDENISLPMLRGPDGSQQEMMEQYQALNQLLLASGLRIREISFNERGSWSLIVTNGLLINIGREQVIEKLQRFVRLYDRQLYTEADALVSIDLRYKNGISIRKKQSAASEVAST
jgi:cell division protein FtsQ